MIKTLSVCAVLGLLPAAARAADPQMLTCAQALEQLATLQTDKPVYKLIAGDERQHINDAERAAELARVQARAVTSCSKDPQERAAQQAEADRLHVALSPECAVARDELAAMEAPTSREPADTLARKRRLVTAKCPDVNTQDLWLIQWDGRSDLAPLE